MSGLVLSLFPGIGLLDQAFEEEGFCVVRGPDLLWGGDIRLFHPPQRFDGIIGGPPCQSWSGLGAVNRARWGDGCMMPDQIPEFARCINEAQPRWYLMENVPAAPAPETPGYSVVSRLCNNRWCGGEQNRERAWPGAVGDSAGGLVHGLIVPYGRPSSPTSHARGPRDFATPKPTITAAQTKASSASHTDLVNP